MYHGLMCRADFAIAIFRWEGAYILISTSFLFSLPFTVTFILARASTIQCIQCCPPLQIKVPVEVIRNKQTRELRHSVQQVATVAQHYNFQRSGEFEWS